MLDIMQLSHKELIEAQHVAFLLRWPDLGREHLSYAKSFIMSHFGPKPTAKNRVA